MMTKDILARLRAQRRQAMPDRSLRPDAPTSTPVHREHDQRLESEIATGDLTLRGALMRLRYNRAFAVRHGLAKSQFNDQTEQQP